MTARRLIALSAGLAGIVLAIALATSAGQRPAPRLAALDDQVTAPASPGPRPIGLTDPAKRIRVGLALRGHRGALERFLAEVRTPGSRNYRHFISAAQYGVRFGASPAHIAVLRRHLRARGFSVARAYPQRNSLVVSGSVGLVSRSFSVGFEDYRDARGRRFHRPVGNARVPHDLAPYVTGVGGLSDQPVQPADIPASGLKPIDVAKAYDIQPLYDAGFHGEGQTIAIVSFGTFDPADVQQYERDVLHNTGPAIQRVPVDGGPASSTDSGVAGEVALDTQVIRGIAPKAQIINYEGGGSGSIAVKFADIYNRIVADGHAKIVSNSYGICELGATPGDAKLVGSALDAMVARGMTVFFASGDAGAYDCQQQNPRVTKKVIDFPGGDPNMVDVGGTLLSVRKDGSYLHEQAWSATLERAGGGGGFSMFNTRPPWQTGPGVSQAAAGAGGFRLDPDVAGPSDPDSGYAICQMGKCIGGHGGTSAAAPFWAASMALVAQYARKKHAGELGYMNPVFYKLAATKPRFPPFHDVVRGNNRAYQATPGYDLATGLGSPDIANLAQDYVDYLKSKSK